MPCLYSYLHPQIQYIVWDQEAREKKKEGEKYLQFGFIILPGFVKRLFEVLRKQKICLDHFKNFVSIVKIPSYK